MYSNFFGPKKILTLNGFERNLHLKNNYNYNDKPFEIFAFKKSSLSARLRWSPSPLFASCTVFFAFVSSFIPANWTKVGKNWSDGHCALDIVLYENEIKNSLLKKIPNTIHCSVLTMYSLVRHSALHMSQLYIPLEERNHSYHSDKQASMCVGQNVSSS